MGDADIGENQSQGRSLRSILEASRKPRQELEGSRQGRWKLSHAALSMRGDMQGTVLHAHLLCSQGIAKKGNLFPLWP